MKNGKLKYVFLFWCCFTLVGTLIPIGRENNISQAVDNNQNESTMKISKQIDLPAGVEILKTLVQDGEIYAVGISSSNVAPYNLNGSEYDPKLFVAKYNKELQVETVVDTGYMFSFYIAELYHDNENQKTTANKNEAKRPIYEMYFVDGKLTIVGVASDPTKSKFGGTADTVIEHHVKMIVLMQYDTSLKQLQKVDFSFTPYTYDVEYTSVMNGGFIYILYTPQIPGRFSDSGSLPNEIVRYDLSDLKQHKTANLMETRQREKKYFSYKTMIRYKDGVAVERAENSLSTDGVNEWDYFSGDLKNMGGIERSSFIVFKDHFPNDEAYSDNEVNPSFKTNSGKIYRFSRLPLSWYNFNDDLVHVNSSEGILDAAQDEKGQIVTLKMNKTLKPLLVVRGASGEMTENQFSFEKLSEKSPNINVSTSQNKVVVVIAQKFYLFELDAKVKIDKAGEFNNACYNDVITGSGGINYYDAATNSCYTSKVTVLENENFDFKSIIFKNGKEFIDFKTSKYVNQKSLFLEVKSMTVNRDGYLVVVGHENLGQSDSKGNPYVAIINQDGKIINEVLGDELFLKETNTELRKTPKYVSVKTIGSNYILSGKQEVYLINNYENTNETDYTLPFVQIRNTELQNVEILFNQNVTKYKNYEVESVDPIGQQFMKIMLRHKKTNAVQTALFSFKENKIVNTIDFANNQDVVSGDKIFSIVEGKIIEKDTKGNEITKKPLKMENAQITPMMNNNHHIVSSVNENNKLQFHLIGDDGETLQTQETDIEVLKGQMVMYMTESISTSLGKINFSIVNENGAGLNYEIDAPTFTFASNKSSSKENNNQFIVSLVSGIIVLMGVVGFSTLIFLKRKKMIQQHQGNKEEQPEIQSFDTLEENETNRDVAIDTNSEVDEK